MTYFRSELKGARYEQSVGAPKTQTHGVRAQQSRILRYDKGGSAISTRREITHLKLRYGGISNKRLCVMLLLRKINNDEVKWSWWYSLALREQSVVGELKLTNGSQVFRSWLHIQRPAVAIHKSIPKIKKIQSKMSHF